MVSKKNGHGQCKTEMLAPPPETVPGMPTAKVVTITPEIAIKWLENPSFNVMNRQIRQSDVSNWADIMRRKQWKCNGDAIRISDKGTLLDGQHRLWACVEAKTPFVSYLIEGLPEEVFDTIDVGKKRSASDMLQIHNKITGSEPMKYESAIMASITTVLELKLGVMQRRHSHVITHHDKIEFLKKNPEIRDWVMKARVKGTKRWENTYAANIGAVTFLGSRKFEKKAETFAIGFTTGNDLPVGSPIAALRNRLGAEKHYAKWERMKLIIYAWNLHVSNDSKQTLKMPAEMPVIVGTESPPVRITKDKPKRINKAPAVKRVGRPGEKVKEAKEIAYIRSER